MTTSTNAFFLYPPAPGLGGAGAVPPPSGGLLPEGAPAWLWGQGTPGAIPPFTTVNKGSIYSEVNATDDYTGHVYFKVDEGGDANDWVSALVSPMTLAQTYVDTELHAWELNYTATNISGANMVGLNIAMTTAGTAAAWNSAIYAKVTQGTTKNVNGYISVAEFELINSNTNVSDWFVLVLNANSTTMGSHSSYIALRDYGTTDLNSFLWFPDHTVGTNSSTVLVSTGADATATTYMRVIGPSGTPYWILMTTTAPTGA